MSFHFHHRESPLNVEVSLILYHHSSSMTLHHAFEDKSILFFFFFFPFSLFISSRARRIISLASQLSCSSIAASNSDLRILVPQGVDRYSLSDSSESPIDSDVRTGKSV